jgi:hypothetical protein
MRFSLQASAKSFADIAERQQTAQNTRSPLVYRDAGEARRFTTSPLPDFTPTDVCEGWDLQFSLHINYSNDLSWKKAVDALIRSTSAGEGFSCEARTDRVSILHIYRPLDGAAQSDSARGGDVSMQT